MHTTPHHTMYIQEVGKIRNFARSWNIYVAAYTISKCHSIKKAKFILSNKGLIFADDNFHFLVWEVTEHFRSSVACQLLNQVKQRCCSFTPPGVLHGFYSMGQNSLRLSRMSISNEISEHISTSSFLKMSVKLASATSAMTLVVFWCEKFGFWMP